jgi:hypothetical protein
MARGVKERTFGWSTTDFDPNTAYDALVDAAAKTWEMTTSEVEEFMAQIEYHETMGTGDHTIKQMNGGPGRGLFQYEVGYKEGAWTAKRRFANWMDEQGIDVGAIPEDFSRLGPQLQRAIFLADALAKGGDPKKEGVHDWWLAKHWAGEEKDRFDRSQAFIGSMKSKYDNGY